MLCWPKFILCFVIYIIAKAALCNFAIHVIAKFFKLGRNLLLGGISGKIENHKDTSRDIREVK